MPPLYPRLTYTGYTNGVSSTTDDDGWTCPANTNYYYPPVIREPAPEPEPKRRKRWSMSVPNRKPVVCKPALPGGVMSYEHRKAIMAKEKRC